MYLAEVILVESAFFLMLVNFYRAVNIFLAEYNLIEATRVVCGGAVVVSTFTRYVIA